MKLTWLAVSLCTILASAQWSKPAEHMLCMQADSIVFELTDLVAPVVRHGWDPMPIFPERPGLRRRLRLRMPGARRVDDAAWWPTAPDSLALSWRSGPSRSVFVAARITDSLDLQGQMFFSNHGPRRFFASHVPCMSEPA